MACERYSELLLVGTLICGIPNAGKTTYSNQHYDNVIHYDDVMRQPMSSPLNEACKLLSQASGDVCIEGVFLSARERRTIAKALDGRMKVCVWLNTPTDECKHREDRNRATCLIDSCSALFQPPTFGEGWDEIIVINGTEQIIYKR